MREDGLPQPKGCFDVDSRDEHHWFVAIGASGSDGLKNIKSLLPVLGSCEAVIMVVLHRSFQAPSALQGILQTRTSMPVVVASGGENLRPGSVYLGEPAAHLSLLARQVAGITADQIAHHRNRTVDLLFKSIADHAGPRGIGHLVRRTG